MADCGKTIVFIDELERMHMHYSSREDGSGCNECPARWDCIRTLSAVKLIDVVKYVQKWSDSHPESKPKTYKDAFQEKFPNNSFQDWASWEYEICPKQLFYGIDFERCEGDCEKCWNEPYEGDNTNG